MRHMISVMPRSLVSDRLATVSHLLLYVGITLSAFRQAACVRAPLPRLVNDGTSMANVTAVRGDTVEFRCRVENLGKHMVAFFRDEIPPRLIAYDESVFRHREKYELRPRVNADEWVLRIKDVQETDAGGYQCQLNTNPAASIMGYLNMKIPPAVSRLSTPSAVEVPEGHNVTLSCHADGNPPPTVIWRRADRQIIRYNGANGYGDSVYKGADLRLTRVSRKHMSEYVCVASNGIPPDESWTIKLHVLFKPSVVPQAAVIEAPVGVSTVRLICNVESWPRPHVTWLLNDMELFDSNRYSTEQSVADRYRSLHILEIKNVLPDNFGRYRCVASNDYGRHFADIQLIEAPPPHNGHASSLSEGSRERHSEHSESEEDDTMTNDATSPTDDEDDNGGEFYWIPKINRDGRTALVFLSAADRRQSLVNSSKTIDIENELTRAIVEDNKRFIDYYREQRHRKNVRADDDKTNGVNNLWTSGTFSTSTAPIALPFLLSCSLLHLFLPPYLSFD